MSCVVRCCAAVMMLMLLLLSGCAALVSEPRVTVLSTDLVSIDTNGFDIELLVAATNPNAFDVTLHGYTFDVQLMSVPFTSGGLQKTVQFPAGQTTEVRLPFRVRHSELLGILKRKPDLNRIPYEVDARLNVGTPFGDLSIPVKQKDTLAVPEAYRPDTYLKRILQPLKNLL